MKKTIIAMLALSGVAFGEPISGSVFDANLDTYISDYKTGDFFTLEFVVSGLPGDQAELITLQNDSKIVTQIGQYLGITTSESTDPAGWGLKAEALGKDSVDETDKPLPYMGSLTMGTSRGWLWATDKQNALANITVKLSYSGMGSELYIANPDGEPYVWASFLDGNDVAQVLDLSKISIHSGASISSATLTWQNSEHNIMVSAPPIPEPTTATLSLLALAGLAARRRRK